MNEFAKSVSEIVESEERDIRGNTVSIIPEFEITRNPKTTQDVYLTIKMKSTTGDEGLRTIKVLELPGSDDLGILINGTPCYLPTIITQKYTWLFRMLQGAKKNFTGLDVVAEMYVKTSHKAKLQIGFGTVKVDAFNDKGSKSSKPFTGMFIETTKGAGQSVKKIYLPLCTFLRAFHTDRDYKRLLDEFRDTNNPYLLSIERKTCCDDGSEFAGSVADLGFVKADQVARLGLPEGPCSINNGNMLDFMSRVEDSLSYLCDEQFFKNSIGLTKLSRRVNKAKLAKDIIGENGESLKAGSFISEAAADIIDSQTEVAVATKYGVIKSKRIIREYDKSVRFSSLLPDIIMTYADCLALGGTLDNPEDTASRLFETPEIYAARLIKDSSDELFRQIERNIERYKEQSPLTTLCDIDLRTVPLSHNRFFSTHKPSTPKGQGYPTNTLDDTNILAIESRRDTASFDAPNRTVGDSMRMVKERQFGRLDPLDSAESNAVGVNNYKAVDARISKSGNLEAPFYKVENGVNTGEIVYVGADEEVGAYVAPHDVDLSKGSDVTTVRCRLDGDLISVDRRHIKYQIVDGFADMSLMHSLIPFPGCLASKRVVMSCNEHRQALELLKPERAIISTGGECRLKMIGYTLRELMELNQREPQPVTLLNVTRSFTTRRLSLAVRGDDGSVFRLSVSSHFKTTRSALFSYDVVPSVRGGQRYELDDLVLKHHAASITDINNIIMKDTNVDKSKYSLGAAFYKNLRVVYKTHGSATIDDACVISDRLVKDSELTHLELKTLACHVDKNEIVSNYRFTCKPGDTIHFGDPLLVTEGKDGEEPKGLIVYENMEEGYVVSTTTTMQSDINNANEVKRVFLVTYALFSNIKVGDKMAGRHGNKTTIAKIIPESMMPFDPVTGFRADIILSPLGIPSRQNISQLYEVVLALYARNKDKNNIFVLPPFEEGQIEWARQLADGDRLRDVNGELVKRELYDPQTGRMFEYELNYGYIAMMKLHHTVETKQGAVGLDGKISKSTGQATTGGSRGGGQRVGEMEVWCLESADLLGPLEEIFGPLSTDMTTRNKYAKAIVKTCTESGIYKNQHYDGKDLYESFTSSNTLTNHHDALANGMIKEAEGDTIESIRFMTSEEIRALSPSPVISSADKASASLHAPGIFGAVTNANFYSGKTGDELDSKGYANWGWIDLKTEIVHPLYLVNTRLRDLGVTTSGAKTKDGKDKVRNFCHLLTYADDIGLNADCTAIVPAEEAGNLCGYNAVQALVDRNKGKIPLVNAWPVLPAKYRPKNGMSSSGLDTAYSTILSLTNSTTPNPAKLESALADLLGLDTFFNQKDRDRKMKSLKRVTVKSTFEQKSGDVRSNQLGRRVFSSFRGVISPADLDGVARGPLYVGIPFATIVEVYDKYCESILQNASRECRSNLNAKHDEYKYMLKAIAENDFISFSRYCNKINAGTDAQAIFSLARATIQRQFNSGIGASQQLAIEDRPVVIVGREPSLHPYSTRAFYPYIADGKSIRIHPVGCSGFNADFDGDQMWGVVVHTEDDRIDAIAHGSVLSDTSFGKDDTSTIVLAQDEVLGVYYMTQPAKDNVEPIYIGEFSQDKIKDELKRMLVPKDDSDRGSYILPSQPVVLKVKTDKGDAIVQGTAGRVLFNYLVGCKVGIDGKLKYDGVVGDNVGDGACDFNINDILKDSIKNVVESMTASGVANVSKPAWRTKLLCELNEMVADLCVVAFIMSEKSGISLSVFDYQKAAESYKKISDSQKVIQKMYEEDKALGLLSDTEFYRCNKEVCCDK